MTAPPTSLQSLIIGTWSLISFEVIMTSQASEGQEHIVFPMGKSPIGQHIFTKSGHTSAHILNPGQKLFESGNFFNASVEEHAESSQRYMAWAGHWNIQENLEDDETKILEYEVKTCNFPNQVGKKQKRLIHINNEEQKLIVKSLMHDETKFVYQWKRVSDE